MRCSALNLLIQVIVIIEHDCIVTFKPVALFTQAIAELVQNGDYPFFILPYAVCRMWRVCHSILNCVK